MKIYKLILVFLCGITLFPGCHKSKEDSHEPMNINSQIKSKNLIEASNELGLNIFKIIDSLSIKNGNFFISPLSIYQALSMAYNGSNGDTRIAMAKTLGFPENNYNTINEYNQTLTRAILQADKNVTLEIANSIWYRLGFAVQDSFLSINQKYYNAEVKAINFSDPNAKDIINSWCKEKTHGKIPKIIEQIPEDVVMYLINAIYFKAMWKYKFDKTLTYEAPFYKEDKSTVNCNLMQLKAEIDFYEDEQIQAIRLPYGNGTFNMVILLPQNDIPVKTIIEKLSSERWHTINSHFIKKELTIRIPRFKFEYKSLLNNPLTQAGMGIAFSDLADFSRINPNILLKISRVIHKTYVEVNEEGTEAAAVTVIEFEKTSALPDIFEVNRPFVFAITEQSTGVILFMGKITDPTIMQEEFK